MKTDILIIGAGPFGLAVAAYLKHLGLDYLVVGKPMEFWEKNMPEGMLLRSPTTWHLDVEAEVTIARYLELEGLTAQQAEPLSLEFYVRYVRWFQAQKQLNNLPVHIRQLDKIDNTHFVAITDDDSVIEAKSVVIAVGFKYFTHIPADIAAVLPINSYSHTCDFVDLKHTKGKRCLIIGGRQSAFEWAALLAEARATAVHIAYRHNTPAFAEADWSWVESIVEGMTDNPNWYRQLSDSEKKQVTYNLWAEGRLKLEPWLKDRILAGNVHLLPNSCVSTCIKQTDSSFKVQFDTGNTVIVDYIILATGYKSAVENIPFLKNGNILPRLLVHEGYPQLDEHFQTNVSGLFMTSLPAGQGFGPFFGFTVAARASAALIGRCLAEITV